MQKKEEDISYVKIDNANMVKLSLKKLANLYADYAHLIISIKKMNDKKTDLRKQLFDRLMDLETKYNAFIKEIPKLPEGLKLRAPEYPSEKGATVEYTRGDPLEDLRQEFENIRGELDKLR